MPPVEIHDEQVDVAVIVEAIRERVRQRPTGRLPVARSEVEAAAAARLRPLADWDLPAETWAAMWPPNHLPWNLDQDYPIRSHRRLVGPLLVGGKRLWRAALAFLARPLLVQQVAINRTLALLTRTLADEVSAQQLRLGAVDQRLARVSEVLREMRGEAEPLCVFTDPPPPGEERG